MMHSVEWDMLLFFAAQFVMVEVSALCVLCVCVLCVCVGKWRR